MASSKHVKILSATTTGGYVVCGSDIGTVNCINLKQRFEAQRERSMMHEDSDIDDSGSEKEENESGNTRTVQNAMVVECESPESSDPCDEFCIPSACGAVYAMQFLGAGNLLACSGDDSINIWRWPSLLEHAGQHHGKDSRTISPATRLVPQPVSSLARGATPPTPEANSMACTSPSATQLLAGYGDSCVRVWDLASGKCVRALRGTTQDAVYCVESKSPNVAISGGEDGCVRTWDLRVAADRETSCTHIGDWVSCLSLEPDGNFVVCGGAHESGRGGILSVIYLPKQAKTASCNSPSVPNAVSFNRATIAMVGSDPFVRRWNSSLSVLHSCSKTSSRAAYCVTPHVLDSDQSALVVAGASPFLDVFLLSCSRALSIKVF